MKRMHLALYPVGLRRGRSRIIPRLNFTVTRRADLNSLHPLLVRPLILDVENKRFQFEFDGSGYTGLSDFGNDRFSSIRTLIETTSAALECLPSNSRGISEARNAVAAIHAHQEEKK